jgi:general secretion pathway protein J
MKSARGFTLIEIMVAVLIAAILAVMAFEAMQQAIANRDRIRSNAVRLQALQFTLRSFVQDFSQLTPRPIREPLGEGYQGALVGTTAASTQVLLTRGGWMNPAGIERSTLQRVRYTLQDGKLNRSYWTVLDAQLDPAPVSRELLNGVRVFKIRYMNFAHIWQDNWPPPSVSPTPSEHDLRQLPIAVEVTLELEDWGRLTRLIEVAG